MLFGNTTRSRALLLLCGALTLSITACGPDKTVSAEALQGVMNPVLDRHDSYVVADTTISDVERDAYLRSSDIVRVMVNTAIGPE